MKFEDNFRQKGLRKKLVETIRGKGIEDQSVLEAINELPRHWFMQEVNSALMNHAYEDKAFPIGDEQTISQPYTVAFQTQLLEIKKGDKILEIGTGSGYQTAILKKLGAKVYTIERQKNLYLKTKKLLQQLNFRAKTFFGDGYKGLPTFAPFDKIIVTCGAPYVPDALLEQLAVGGILVIPEGEGKVQVMKRIIKQEDGSLDMQTYGEFSFVPMLGNKNF